jgi:hypothetical protein
MTSDWQPIETAPKDGTLIRARGHDFGDKLRKHHEVTAKWWPTRGWGGRSGFSSTGGEALPNESFFYLEEWKPARD